MCTLCGQCLQDVNRTKDRWRKTHALAWQLAEAEARTVMHAASMPTLAPRASAAPAQLKTPKPTRPNVSDLSASRSQDSSSQTLRSGRAPTRCRPRPTPVRANGCIQNLPYQVPLLLCYVFARTVALLITSLLKPLCPAGFSVYDSRMQPNMSHSCLDISRRKRGNPNFSAKGFMIITLDLTSSRSDLQQLIQDYGSGMRNTLPVH